MEVRSGVNCGFALWTQILLRSGHQLGRVLIGGTSVYAG